MTVALVCSRCLSSTSTKLLAQEYHITSGRLGNIRVSNLILKRSHSLQLHSKSRNTHKAPFIINQTNKQKTYKKTTNNPTTKKTKDKTNQPNQPPTKWNSKEILIPCFYITGKSNITSSAGLWYSFYYFIVVPTKHILVEWIFSTWLFLLPKFSGTKITETEGNV